MTFKSWTAMRDSQRPACLRHGLDEVAGHFKDDQRAEQKTMC